MRTWKDKKGGKEPFDSSIIQLLSSKVGQTTEETSSFTGEPLFWIPQIKPIRATRQLARELS